MRTLILKDIEMSCCILIFVENGSAILEKQDDTAFYFIPIMDIYIMTILDELIYY